MAGARAALAALSRRSALTSGEPAPYARGMRCAWLLLVVGCGSGDPAPADMALPERYTCAPRPDATAAYAHTTAPTGPRAGTACVAGGCHLEGQLGAGATALAFAGTIFKEAAGSTAAGRVTVRLFKPFQDTALASATTDDAGNFVIRGSFAAFPYQIDATACGAQIPLRPMSSELGASDHSCSASGICHGGSEGPIVFAD